MKKMTKSLLLAALFCNVSHLALALDAKIKNETAYKLFTGEIEIQPWKTGVVDGKELRDISYTYAGTVKKVVGTHLISIENCKTIRVYDSVIGGRLESVCAERRKARRIIKKICIPKYRTRCRKKCERNFLGFRSCWDVCKTKKVGCL